MFYCLLIISCTAGLTDSANTVLSVALVVIRSLMGLEVDT